ncbi:MAG: TlpA disulfide reductase family protein [Balneolaceae bacterium]|nr:TlpA disulfide reductase family protein [Balneolaceae bacterium]
MKKFLKCILIFLGILLIGATPIDKQGIDDDLLKDVDAEQLKEIIKSYEGEKAVLINIWATWCAPCIEEFPESRDRALEFLKKQGVDWTTYFKTGKDNAFIEAVSEDWSGALPFTKIINKEGEVVSYWENSASFSKFEKHVNKALTP